MIIYDTGIQDTTLKNLSDYKNRLLQRILYLVLPLIRKDINSKILIIKKKKKEIKNTHNQILELKIGLNELENISAKKKKINILLTRIFNTISINNFNDSELKTNLIKTVENIDTLSDEQIEYHSSEIIKIISEKLSKSDSDA